MGLYLSAEMPDYSEALEAIEQQLTNISVQFVALSETAKLAVGVLAGIVCVLGIIFGFKFIEYLLETIWRG